MITSHDRPDLGPVEHSLGCCGRSKPSSKRCLAAMERCSGTRTWYQYGNHRESVRQALQSSTQRIVYLRETEERPASFCGPGAFHQRSTRVFLTIIFYSSFQLISRSSYSIRESSFHQKLTLLQKRGHRRRSETQMQMSKSKIQLNELRPPVSSSQLHQGMLLINPRVQAYYTHKHLSHIGCHGSSSPT